MRRSIFAITVAFLLAATPVLSAQGGPKPKPVSSKTTSVKKPTTTTKVKTVSAASTTKAPKVQKSVVKGAKSTSKPVKSTATTTSATKSAKAQVKAETKLAKADGKAAKSDARAETKAAKADAKAEKKTAATSATTTDGDGTTPPENGDAVTLTPVQEKLQRNTNLASKLEKKLEGRLPQGTDLMDAALGFKNLGQFVAAVNVSTNLQLDFIELKTRMVDQKMSLGQAIQDLKATASPTVEAQRAEYDARVMIATSESEMTVASSNTTATTTTAKKPTKSKKKAVGGAQ